MMQNAVHILPSIFVVGAFVESSKKIIGQNLARILRERDFTQAEAADKLGYAQSYVNRILQGKANWTADTLDRICKAFKIELSELCFQPEREKSEEERLREWVQYANSRLDQLLKKDRGR